MHSFDDDLHFVTFCKVSVGIMTGSEHMINFMFFVLCIVI